MALDTFEALYVTIYYVTILFIGVWAGRRLHLLHHPDGAPSTPGPTTDGLLFLKRYLLYNRSLPIMLAIGSMTATWVGGGYLNGSAEAIYTGGLVHCQAPLGYALSLVLGGLLFAPKIRATNALTMLDPFEWRYGRFVSLMLMVPAICSEVMWSASVLAAFGSAARVIVEVDVRMAILFCAAVTLVYTSLGGLYSVATTDVFQVSIMTVGLWSCVPFCLKNDATGRITGPDGDWVGSISDVHLARALDEFATTALGGIAWQVCFKRVLACKTTFQAQLMMTVSAVGCLVLAWPAMIIGASAKTTNFTVAGYPGPYRLSPENQHEVLPYSIRYLTPHRVSLLGLAAISGAAMSSVDSSALSMASLLGRNLYLSMRRPTAGSGEMAAVVRITVFVVVLVSTAMALSVRSVYSLWNLSSDLAYVLLFPQLVCLFFLTEHTNTYGVLAGFTAGLVVRSLSGEPSVNLDGLLTLPMHRTLSMLASLSITLLVSFIFKELFARGEIKDYLQCFVVSGQDNSGRLLVKSGLHPISPPVMEPVPERPGLVDRPEADTGANTHTPICLPEAVTEECEVPKPDDPELQLSTAMRRSSTQEYQNDVNQSRSSKSPTTRTPKVEGNDDNGGGTPKKASKASTPIHKKASPSSVDRKSTRSSRSTTPRSKSPRKRGSKSGQASLEHECEVPKPDAPELQLSTTLRRSSTEEYRNDVNQSRSSKSPTTRPPKIEGNDDIGGGTPNKASQASTPVRKKASTSSVGRKSARSSRSTTPRSKSPRKRGSKSCQASVEQSP